MYKILTTDELEEGMVLHETAKDNFGHFLFPIGTLLTSNVIETLKKWFSGSIIVKTANEVEVTDFTEEQISNSKEKILNRMNWEPENNFELEIFQMAVNHYLFLNQGAI